MNTLSVDVDRVVREVLAQLDLAPETNQVDTVSVDAAPVDAVPAGTNGSAKTTKRAADNDLVLSCRVVTLADVENRLEGLQRLVVPPHAVVTPSVRDELYRRNVALEFASPETAEMNVAARLVLATAGKRFDPAALIVALHEEAIEVESHAFDCLIAATDRLAAEVLHSNRAGLLLTRYPAAALCLANRHSGVRAVSGTDVSSIAAATASIGANVLAVDPTTVGSFRLKQIATEFCRGGIRACPEVFREQLG